MSGMEGTEGHLMNDQAAQQYANSNGCKLTISEVPGATLTSLFDEVCLLYLV